MRHASPSMPVALVAMFALGITWAAASEAPSLSAILTSGNARTEYMAHARIWKHPGILSPDDILDGPSGVFPYTFAEVTSEDGIACTFMKPGNGLGGNTPKFVCQTSDGRALRVKYWDPERETGNREVFATVAATRLMWALGFDALQALPMNLRCERCPTNPMTGGGTPRAHRYLAELRAFPPNGPLILSREDRAQGWSWRELDDAIAGLPAGVERTRQRRDFDALTLLGVFMQHGDRKPDQQLLYCHGPVDLSAGEVRPWESSSDASILLERPARLVLPASGGDDFRRRRHVRRSGPDLERRDGKDESRAVAEQDGVQGRRRRVSRPVDRVARRGSRRRSQSCDFREWPPVSARAVTASDAGSRAGYLYRRARDRCRPMGRGIPGQGPADRRSPLPARGVSTTRRSHDTAAAGFGVPVRPAAGVARAARGSSGQAHAIAPVLLGGIEAAVSGTEQRFAGPDIVHGRRDGRWRVEGLAGDSNAD